MPVNKELPWIEEARKHIGLTEIPGKNHNSTITNWLHALHAWWTDDETPWCGVFVAHCLRTAGRNLPKNWFRAREYEKYGSLLAKPAYGCIAVLTRQGGGHVAFVVGVDNKGNVLLLGGNQGNRVSIAAFPRSRVSAYVWPELSDGKKSIPSADRYVLAEGSAAKSTSEA